MFLTVNEPKALCFLWLHKIGYKNEKRKKNGMKKWKIIMKNHNENGEIKYQIES